MIVFSKAGLILAGTVPLLLLEYQPLHSTSKWSFPLALPALHQTVEDIGLVKLADLYTTENKEKSSIGSPPTYQELRNVRLEHAGHIRNRRLRKDRFEFEFEVGHLYLLEPVEDRITGAVFLGKGKLRFFPPDAIEQHQLKKFLNTDYLDESFDRAVFRFSDNTATQLKALIEPTKHRNVKTANKLLENRREELLDRQLINLDSRLLADLLVAQAAGKSLQDTSLVAHSSQRSLGKGYFHAEIDGDEHNWITIEIEPRHLEEVQIFRFDDGPDVRDTWSGFHALEDFISARFPDPFTIPIYSNCNSFNNDEKKTKPDLPIRPAIPDREGWSRRVKIPDVSVDLSLDGNGYAKATSAIIVEPLRPLTTIRLNISPFLQVTDVRWIERAPLSITENKKRSTSSNTEDETSLRWSRHAGKLSLTEKGGEEHNQSQPQPVTGKPLHFVQEQQTRRMAKDLYEPWVTVILPKEVSKGENFGLEIAYEGELVERLLSRDFFLRDTSNWYPKHPDVLRSSFKLTFRVPEQYQIATGGRLIDDHVTDKIRIIRRSVDDPVQNMSFHYGNFNISNVALDKVPPISIYSNKNKTGFAPGNQKKTLDDLAASIRVHSDYFGPFPFTSLLVTETPALGGQSFPGFLRLSYQTFGALHTGEAELIRSHEIAHQWWGVAIDTESYRDQWLSEGFAQYAAALYILVGLKDEAQFREMMNAWRLDVLGKIDLGQGIGRHYGFRPEIIRRSDGSNSGPLIMGFRLNSAETPNDYRILIYEKGAYILHMLRMMLMDFQSEHDDRYRQMMRRFAKSHMHNVINTSAFEAAVTEAFGEPMDWFFDQWVYGVEVPAYRQDLEIVRTGASDMPFALKGTILQEDVRSGFKMPVPIRLTFENRPPLTHRILVDAERVEVNIPLPAYASDIEFNYLNSVLAQER